MLVNNLKAICLIIPLMLVFQQVNARIYKWVDEDGVTHFSQEKPAHLKTNFVNKKTPSKAKLKSLLYPFGSAAILKGSKKTYCNKSAALTLLRNKIFKKKREISKYKLQHAIKDSNLPRKNNSVNMQLQSMEREALQYESQLSFKPSKEQFFSAMQRKCRNLKKQKLVDKEIYDIGFSGYKRVFKKKDREYIGYIGIGLSKYSSSADAKNKWNSWSRKSNQKKYTRVKKEKWNGIRVLLMDDNADFAVAFILLDDVLIEVQFGSNRFVEFKQLQYFIKRYTRWLSANF